MKRIALCFIFIFVLLGGCGLETNVEPTAVKADTEDGFTFDWQGRDKVSGIHTYIMKDEKYGTEYLIVNTSQGTSITPRLAYGFNGDYGIKVVGE